MCKLSSSKNKWLRQQTEFKAVRGTRLKVKAGQLLLLVKPNALPYPRLGLAIAKKQVKLAIKRNRVKRIARESFRQHSDSLPCVDMVLLVCKRIDELDNKELHQCLRDLWQQLIKRFRRFSSS